VIRCALKVVHFNEEIGMPTSHKGHFENLVARIVVAPHKLPWREWYSGIGASVGKVDGDKAAAVAVLQAIHASFEASKQPIEVWQDNQSKIFVTASKPAKEREIILPPCVPKQSKVYEVSVHPSAVPCTITWRKKNTADLTACVGGLQSTATYFVLPEFKGPKKKPGRRGCDDTAAVAVNAEAAILKSVQEQVDGADKADSGSAVDEDPAVADEWAWGPEGQETMNPFWAVRRLTQKQMTQASTVHKSSEGRIPRFNCTLEPQVMSCVTVGVLQGSHSVNTTRSCEVWFLVNNVDVDEGEELFLEIKERQEEKKSKRTWIHAFQEEEKAAKSKAKGIQR
jgi:hypothetical protein